VSSDPDALWKPGFAGEVVYPTRDPVPAPRLSRSPRHHRVLVGATIVVAALVAVTAIAITRLGGDPAQAAAPRLPLHVTERWSVTMPGQVWDITASDDVVLAAAHGSDARITALRADTGAELWSRSGDRARLAAVWSVFSAVPSVSTWTRSNSAAGGVHNPALISDCREMGMNSGGSTWSISA